MKKIENIIKNKNLKSIILVLISSVMMATVTKIFVRPAGIMSGGFMGIAIMIDMVADLFGMNIPTSIGLLCLNIPVALFCIRKISRRFVCFSLAQVILTSIFLQILPFQKVMGEELLNVAFGGFLFGFSIVIALKGNASSGGTDFIALYVANKSGREIWTQVFCFNAIMFTIFGMIFGFDKAGYSIIFQFISTKTISTFHTRYKRVMLQIFTKEKEKVVQSYLKHSRHGLTVMDGKGGYTKDPVSMITAIVSSYEVDDVIDSLKEADEHIIINVTKSERYVGRFYTQPL